MRTELKGERARSYELTVRTTEVGRRMMLRLCGGKETRVIIWEKERNQLLLHCASLVVRSLPGWLLVNLEVESDQTQPQLLQFVFYLGKREQSSGTRAACTINSKTALGAQLAESWGRDLQRVLWDAVLDAIEASVVQAAQQFARAVTLGGFFSDKETIHIKLIAGEL